MMHRICKMKKKRKANESWPQYVERTFPNLSQEDKTKITDAIKEAWFDGIEFERNIVNH